MVNENIDDMMISQYNINFPRIISIIRMIALTYLAISDHRYVMLCYVKNNNVFYNYKDRANAP